MNQQLSNVDNYTHSTYIYKTHSWFNNNIESIQATNHGYDLHDFTVIESSIGLPHIGARPNINIQRISVAKRDFDLELQETYSFELLFTRLPTEEDTVISYLSCLQRARGTTNWLEDPDLGEALIERYENRHLWDDIDRRNALYAATAIIISHITHKPFVSWKLIAPSAIYNTNTHNHMNYLI